MRKTILSLLMAAAVAVSAQAQSTQELIEAYRNGTLSQSQIDQLKAEESASNVNRTRQVNAAALSVPQRNQSQRPVVVVPDSLASDSTSMAYIVPNEADRSSRIFGHDMFANEQLTFEPNLSIATPDNYVLGPGDEVIVDVWGDSQTTARFSSRT